MGMFSVDDLDINPRIISSLKRAHLTDLKSIFHLSNSEVEKITGLSSKDVTAFFQAASLAVPAPKAVQVLDLKKNEGQTFLTTGCEVLDAFLKGGIRLQCITEIAGESAAGKSQLCLQLSITCQLPVDLGGLEGAAVYICTEDAFPNRRLAQMVNLLRSRSADKRVADMSFMDKIFIQHEADLDGLRTCVFYRLPQLLKHRNIKLIVLDSIAALFRTEFTVEQMAPRAKLLSQFGSQLRKLAHMHNVPVVCVNQVSDSFCPEGHEDGTKSSKRLVPALGLSWSSLVTTRLMLTRSSRHMTYTSHSTGSSYDVNVRDMEVVFSPYLPNTICRFVIDEDGFKGLA